MKYYFRKQSSFIFLIAYLSFIATGIFHVHSGQISLHGKTVLTENLSSIGKDPYSDGGSNCLINQLANSLSISFHSSHNLTERLETVDLILHEDNTSPHETLSLTSHSLRAPPKALPEKIFL